MSENWLNERLCSLKGDTVRIEQGPNRVTVDVTAASLSNEVTAPHYQLGAKDAAGNRIKTGGKMQILDYYAKPVWYVYGLIDDESTAAGKRWEPLEIFPDRDQALTFARSL